MAVSYLSTVYESNPYVLPVDLELLGKVNSYKQGLFYQNANALKQQYNTLKNSYIMNPEQAKVLEEKYNNLVGQISNWGAVDYSDMGIVNQMEGYANSIYSDPTVLNGIASTKKAQTLLTNYEKMKTDPKLMKYYNRANEEWDLQEVVKYTQGGKDAKYNGSTSPTIYKGNPYTRLTEGISKIKPDLITGIDPVSGNPYFIEKSTMKYLDPERVMAEMSGKLDSDIMNQVNIDAWYNMRGVSDDKLEQEYTKNYQSRVASYDNLIGQYKKDLATAVDKEKIANINADIAKLEASKAEANSNYNLPKFKESLKTEEGKQYQRSNIYLNRLFADGVKSFSYREVQKSYIQNIAQLQADKFTLEQLRFENAKELVKLKAMYSGKEGKTPTGLASGDGSLAVLESNTQTDDELKNEQITTKTVQDRIAAIETDNGRLLNDFFINNGTDSKDGTRFLGQPTQEALKKRLGEIAILDGKESLSLQDIKYFLQGKRIDEKGNVVQTNTSTNLLPNTHEKEFFQNAINAFDAAAKGDFESLKNVNFNKQEFLSTYGKYVDNNEALKGQNYLLGDSYSKAFETVSAEKKLSESEKVFVKEYIKNPAKYGNLSTVTIPSLIPGKPSGVIPDRWFLNKNNKELITALVKMGIATKVGNDYIVPENILKSSKDQMLAKEQQKQLNQSEYRQNYYTIPLDWKTIKDKNATIASTASTLLRTRGGIDGEKHTDFSTEDVIVTGVTANPTTSKEYKNGEPFSLNIEYKNSAKDVIKVKVPINNNIAVNFGVENGMNFEKEATLNNVGYWEPKFNYAVGWGDKGIFKTQIKRPNGKDGEVHIVVTDGKENIILRNYETSSGTLGKFSNGAQADLIIQKVIQNAPSRYATREDFIQALRELEAGKLR